MRFTCFLRGRADIDILPVEIGQRGRVIAVLGSFQCADKNRMRAKFVTVRCAADQAGLRAGKDGDAVPILPVPHGKPVHRQRLHEMFRHITVAHAEHVDAKCLRPRHRIVQGRCLVDTDQQGRRIKAQRADGGCKNAEPLTVNLRRYGIYRRRDMPHGIAKVFDQVGMGLDSFAHKRHMTAREALRKQQIYRRM